MFDSVCTLIKILESISESGDVIRKEEQREEVFCNEKSVRVNQFYQAHAQWYKVELILELRQVDYNGEEYIIYDKVKYKIFRTYKKNREFIELTLIKGVD